MVAAQTLEGRVADALDAALAAGVPIEVLEVVGWEAKVRAQVIGLLVEERPARAWVAWLRAELAALGGRYGGGREMEATR